MNPGCSSTTENQIGRAVNGTQHYSPCRMNKSCIKTVLVVFWRPWNHSLWVCTAGRNPFTCRSSRGWNTWSHGWGLTSQTWSRFSMIMLQLYSLHHYQFPGVKEHPGDTPAPLQSRLGSGRYFLFSWLEREQKGKHRSPWKTVNSILQCCLDSCRALSVCFPGSTDMSLQV